VDCRQSIASTIRPPTLQACRRAAAAAGQRVPSCQKGRGLQLRAWLIVGGASARLLGLKVCVCGPRSRPCGPAQAPPAWRRWCGDCGLVARSGRRVLRRLSPVASLWGWVACALWQPHGLSGSRVGGASEGAVVAAGGLRFGGQRHGPKLAGSWQLRHAHRVSVSGTQRLGCHSSLTQQASGLFVASSVARKPILPL
jgi:hypothetical protein